MTKLVKLAFIAAVATIAIAATHSQMRPLSSPNPGMPAATAVSISPAEMMRTSGPLPATMVDSYF